MLCPDHKEVNGIRGIPDWNDGSGKCTAMKTNVNWYKIKEDLVERENPMWNTKGIPTNCPVFGG